MSTTIKSRRVALLVICLWLLVSGPGCAPAPLAPGTPTAGGTWIGTHQISSCAGGVDFRACSRFPGTGTLTLTLADTSGAISGMLTIEVPSPDATSVSHLTTAHIPVTGTLSSTYELRLTGTTVVLDETPYGAELARVDDWNAAIGPGVMGGRIVLMTSGFFPGFGFPQQFRVTSDLANVKKSDGSPR